MIDLHDGGLIRMAHPANGERPDLTEAIEAGHAALADGPCRARLQARPSAEGRAAALRRA